MKLFSKFALALMAMVMAFTACEKVDDLPFFAPVANTGAPVLTSSAATWAPLPADSNNVGLRLNWTRPPYTVDSNTIKYVVEIDSATRNFSNPLVRVVTGSLTTSFTNKELNNFFLNTRGLNFNTNYNFEIRVTSSHANNNEPLRSNLLLIRFTPYKVPPRVALPATNELYMVGEAVTGIPNWNNPAGPRSGWPAFRRLWRKDETTWEAFFNMNGGGSYLILPQFGDVWSNKYSVQNNSIAGLANGGAFGLELPDNIPGNVSGGAGWHKLIFDFQQGRFSVTRVTTANFMLPENLWITGDATGSNWVNNPPSSQQFIQLNNGVFQLDIALQPGRFFKFLSTQNQWQPQFGQVGGSPAGAMGAAYVPGPEPDAIPTPTAAGNYRITVNFHTNTYTIVRI